MPENTNSGLRVNVRDVDTLLRETGRSGLQPSLRHDYGFCFMTVRGNIKNAILYAISSLSLLFGGNAFLRDFSRRSLSSFFTLHRYDYLCNILHVSRSDLSCATANRLLAP
jgi:hypothetical protein